MNLKELIESNKNQFKESTVFEDLSEDLIAIDFNNKLKAQFIVKNNKLAIIILKQDERYWNRDENFKYNNKFNFQSFNGWTIRTNNYTYFDIDNEIVDLKGYNLEDNNEYWSTYYNESNIINLILALEDWSINCPYFKEEIKEEEIKLNNANDSILQQKLEFVVEIDKLKAQLIAKENKIEELHEQLNIKQGDINCLESDLKNARDIIEQRNSQLLNRDNEIKELKIAKKVLLEIIKGV